MSSMKEEIAAQYQNFSVYVLLSSRGALPGFHWGIFIPTASPLGHFWHATNREGGWKREHKYSGNAQFSPSPILSQKIGTVDPDNIQACCDVLDAILADGTPSPNTGEPFSCRVWVKDAIIALQNNQIIVLPDDIDEVESSLLVEADRYRDEVETGGATHVNNLVSLGS